MAFWNYENLAHGQRYHGNTPEQEIHLGCANQADEGGVRANQEYTRARQQKAFLIGLHGRRYLLTKVIHSGPTQINCRSLIPRNRRSAILDNATRGPGCW